MRFGATSGDAVAAVRSPVTARIGVENKEG